MDSLELVLAMVLAVVASGYLVRVLPFSLPLPLAQIALGALIAEVFHHSVVLNPEISFLLFLPPLFLSGVIMPLLSALKTISAKLNRAASAGNDL